MDAALFQSKSRMTFFFPHSMRKPQCSTERQQKRGFEKRILRSFMDLEWLVRTLKPFSRWVTLHLDRDNDQVHMDMCCKTNGRIHGYLTFKCLAFNMDSRNNPVFK